MSEFYFLSSLLSLFSLDEMLREVISLCTTTSEGQARASACELLHALFLISVATEQQTPKKVKVSLKEFKLLPVT